MIIPVYNDLESLINLYRQIDSWQYKPNEIIVVEPDSNCQCSQFCSTNNIKHIKSEIANRGAQLDLGARNSEGDILWFVHSDATFSNEPIKIIKEMSDTSVVGGFFRFSFFNEQTLKAKLFEWLINLRTKVGIPYGDQAIFVNRESYFETDGFETVPLFEEVRLVKRLRKLGKFIELPIKVEVNPRKWHKDGWFFRSATNRILTIGYMLGVSPQKLSNIYLKKRIL